MHDVILASAIDQTVSLATRRGCYLALDALAGDPEFLGNTCDCRSAAEARRKTWRRTSAKTANVEIVMDAEEASDELLSSLMDIDDVSGLDFGLDEDLSDEGEVQDEGELEEGEIEEEGELEGDDDFEETGDGPGRVMPP